MGDHFCRRTLLPGRRSQSWTPYVPQYFQELSTFKSVGWKPPESGDEQGGSVCSHGRMYSCGDRRFCKRKRDPCEKQSGEKTGIHTVEYLLCPDTGSDRDSCIR